MKKKGIAIICIIAVLAVICIGFFLLHGGKSHQETLPLPEEGAEEITEEAEETGKTEEAGKTEEGEKTEAEAEGGEAGVFLKIPYKEYEICLVKTEQEDEYNIVLKKDAEETVLLESIYIEDLGTCKVEIFDELMGFEGFYFFRYEGFFPATSYFGLVEGKPVLLGEGWGNEADENHITDIDKDGKSELICNVIYGGDGAGRTVIYRYDNEQILQGFGDDLLDEEYDKESVGNEYSCYLPEENVIEISYRAAGEEDYRSKKYEIALDKINWEKFEA